MQCSQRVIPQQPGKQVKLGLCSLCYKTSSTSDYSGQQALIHRQVHGNEQSCSLFMSGSDLCLPKASQRQGYCLSLAVICSILTRNIATRIPSTATARGRRLERTKGVKCLSFPYKFTPSSQSPPLILAGLASRFHPQTLLPLSRRALSGRFLLKYHTSLHPLQVQRFGCVSIPIAAFWVGLRLNSSP